MGRCQSRPILPPPSALERQAAATEMKTASPPAKQEEAATSAPPPQSHPDDGPGPPPPTPSSQQRPQSPPSVPAPVPAPAPPPPMASVQSEHLRLILSMTLNKPLDASDVRDDDEIAFNDAKNEIRRIRNLAAEFLVNNAMTMRGEDDDEEEVKEEDEEVREALYDKQDMSSFVPVKIYKTPDVHSLIYSTIKPIVLFENASNEEILQIIEVFRPETFGEGEVVIRRGDMGSEFYVVESGDLSEQVEDGVGKARVYSRGDAFGESALIFGSPSASTITATSDVRVWILERNVYSSVISKIRQEQYMEKQQFIRDCVVGDRPFSTIFDFHHIEDLAIAAKVDNFEEGDVILREGEMVETFYIVRSGTVERYKRNYAGNEVKAGTIEERKVFGTTSLLKGVGSPYTYRASSRVKIFYLTHNDFESILGSVKDAFDGNTATRSMWRDASRSTIITSSSLRSVHKCDLDDLNIYKMLGRGAFGHVMLVQSKKTKRLFALKAQSKYKIFKNRNLQDRIRNEFRNATQVEHKNLMTIHCAMQDKKYVYFLLDLLPGGQLMDHLHNMKKIRHGRRAFEEDVVKFYAASVVLAFEQLHNCMIAYRDLKPENIVLNKKGYGVLVDFGLTKEVEGLTYTFVGTWDYISPETIRKTGHNWAVDYWALGVFLFEMTSGTAPFHSRIQSERERKILKGFELVNVPPYFTSGLTDLISQLLITDQSKRLGRTQNGIQSIKNHRWFAGFDWEGFEKQNLRAPHQPELPQDMKEIGRVADIKEVPNSEWWPDLKSWETRF